MRTDKTNYYLDIAETVLERGTCLRRNYGAIIVKNDQIISTGYVGAPRGRQNCIDMGVCVRENLKVPRGERYELCRSVHAEANAIISAARRDMLDATLYLAGRDAKTGEILPDTVEKLKAIDGVKTAQWDEVTKDMVVTFDTKKTSKKDIQRAIVALGFTAGKMKPEAGKEKKHDPNCGKGDCKD